MRKYQKFEINSKIWQFDKHLKKVAKIRFTLKYKFSKQHKNTMAYNSYTYPYKLKKKKKTKWPIICNGLKIQAAKAPTEEHRIRYRACLCKETEKRCNKIYHLSRGRKRHLCFVSERANAYTTHLLKSCYHSKIQNCGIFSLEKKKMTYNS